MIYIYFTISRKRLYSYLLNERMYINVIINYNIFSFQKIIDGAAAEALIEALLEHYIILHQDTKKV